MKKVIFILLLFSLTKISFAQIKIDTLNFDTTINHKYFETQIQCSLPIIESNKKCFENFQKQIISFKHQLDTVIKEESGWENDGDSVVERDKKSPTIYRYEFSIQKFTKKMLSIKIDEGFDACCNGSGHGYHNYFFCFDLEKYEEVNPEIFLMKKDTIRKIADSIFVQNGGNLPDTTQPYLNSSFLGFQISEHSLLAGYNVYFSGSINEDLYIEIPYDRIKNYLTKQGRKLLLDEEK